MDSVYAFFVLHTWVVINGIGVGQKHCDAESICLMMLLLILAAMVSNSTVEVKKMEDISL